VTSPLHDLVEVAVSLSNDHVANVRLNVGRVFGNVIHLFEDAKLSFVMKALKEQIEEEERQADGGDSDVKVSEGYIVRGRGQKFEIYTVIDVN
jgi:hypothetical protein